MRGLMEKAFTKRSLEAHEPIVQSYISLFISKLSEQAEKSEGQEGAMVDMVDWLNFLTFDIIGDLGFGESIGCLENSKYHPWVQMIFQYLKGMAFLAATRYFPLMESFLKLLIPRSVMHKQREHFALAKERVHRRMNAEKQRNDFMGPIIAANGNGQYISIEEIEASFNILIIAGSETSASVLSGLINELIQEPEVMSNLVKEIRTKFNSEAEISLKTTRELEYLNCCLREALRMCNPVPAGLSRVVPPKGDTVCGIWLPAGVSVPVHCPRDC
jgi:cytochrome P450